MADDFLGDRKKALEETFFARVNAQLIEKMRTDEKRGEQKVRLAEVSGISDDVVLNALVDLEIGADAWAAVALVPLVEVAWADGRMEEKERTAVMAGAEASGVVHGGSAFQLLEGWLRHRPDGRLLEVWGEYIVGLCAQLDPKGRRALRDEVIGRARKVAQATGGFLGMGPKVSPEEDVMLRELERAFGEI